MLDRDLALEITLHTTLTVKERQITELQVIKLDTERVRYIRNAESKYGKVKATQYAWSPTLEKAGETVNSWKPRKSQARGGVCQRLLDF